MAPMFLPSPFIYTGVHVHKHVQGEWGRNNGHRDMHCHYMSIGFIVLEVRRVLLYKAQSVMWCIAQSYPFPCHHMQQHLNGLHCMLWEEGDIGMLGRGKRKFPPLSLIIRPLANGCHWTSASSLDGASPRRQREYVVKWGRGDHSAKVFPQVPLSPAFCLCLLFSPLFCLQLNHCRRCMLSTSAPNGGPEALSSAHFWSAFCKARKTVPTVEHYF